MLGVTKKLRLFLIFFLLLAGWTDVAEARTERELLEETRVVQETEELMHTSRIMVKEAEEVLAKGWSGMSDKERREFESVFDPRGSGAIDQQFVEEVRQKYIQIQQRWERPLPIIVESESIFCIDQRLFYTDLLAIHICPYFNMETNRLRKARGIVHETAHMALLVVDRPYYRPNTYSVRYSTLTPRGSWPALLPIVGPICREIERSDTLYHPDAYAWYARITFDGA